MSTLPSRDFKSEPTPVEEVRRIRERLSRNAGNDVRRLAERAREVAAANRASLGLVPVKRGT